MTDFFFSINNNILAPNFDFNITLFLSYFSNCNIERNAFIQMTSLKMVTRYQSSLSNNIDEDFASSPMAHQNSDDEETHVESIDIVDQNPTGSTENQSNTRNVNQNPTDNGENERRRNISTRIESMLPLCTTDPKNKIPNRYRLIKASEMMKIGCPRHRVYVKLMLILINSGNKVGKEEKYIFSCRKQGRSSNNSSSYGRLLMFLDLSD